MNRTIRAALCACILSALAGAPLPSQDLNGAVDALFGWVEAGAPGCIVVAARRGKIEVERSYGLADLERRIPLSAETVFDVGSVQKQFVAAAVLLLVEEGRVALEDDIRDYIPEMRDYGRAVTIEHLMTHTSGVRDWTGIRMGLGRAWARLVRGDDAILSAIVGQRTLDFRPGERWKYSNSNYVLLREVVERAGGTAFAEFARTRIFEPLGLRSTRYAADIGAAAAGAVAYERRGKAWKPNVPLGSDRGGLALLSTASDLLAWTEALADARLGAFVAEKMRERATLGDGTALDYGHGLFVKDTRSGEALYHTGSAGGYKAFTLRHPGLDVSIVVLSNAGDAAVGKISPLRILDLFVPGPSGPGESR